MSSTPAAGRPLRFLPAADNPLGIDGLGAVLAPVVAVAAPLRGKGTVLRERPTEPTAGSCVGAWR